MGRVNPLIFVILVLFAVAFGIFFWSGTKPKITSPPAQINLEKLPAKQEFRQLSYCSKIVEVVGVRVDKEAILGPWYESEMILEDGRRVVSRRPFIEQPGNLFCIFGVVPVTN